MRVLCVGDSLSLPGHSNKYEDTWIFHLKKKYTNYDFISFFKRHLTTNALVEMGGNENEFEKGADCLEYFMPDIVIIQLGIVDCAPRLIKDKGFTWKIIRRMPNRVIDKYIRYLKARKTRDPKNVIVSEQKFKYNLRTYFDRCKKIDLTKLIYIAIPNPSNELIKKILQLYIIFHYIIIL